MPSSHVTPQVCRPHFHAPLPWLSDPPKPLSSAGSAWGSPFACPQDPQDSKLVGQIQNSQSSSGQHLFSFPPTPPKDSTPDSVQTGPTDYQAAVNVFMHQASNNSNLNSSQSDTNCGLDVKPCLSGSTGQTQPPKQREGTHQQQSTSHSTSSSNSSNNSNNNSQNLNNHTNQNASQHNSSAAAAANHLQQQQSAQQQQQQNHNSASALNGGLFDSTHQSSYGAYETSYLGYPQSSNSVFQSNSRASVMSNSPSSHKPQRTKARTSAGKI